MKHMKVAEARAQFGELLDEAEKGHAVIIERRGVRFRVVVDSVPAKTGSIPALFEHVDDAIASGQWTWTQGPGGLRFAARRKRR